MVLLLGGSDDEFAISGCVVGPCCSILPIGKQIIRI